MLLEKEDKPTPTARTPSLRRAARAVRQADGAEQRLPGVRGVLRRRSVYQWARETNALTLKFNQHVTYIHSKFLLMDPLGDDPIVVTGSANFSDASTKGNDENMLIIRGDQRVADIYFTEFNRLFNHYYFRAVHAKATSLRPEDPANNLFLREKPAEWLAGYKPGRLRQKRVEVFAKMRGFTTL